MALTNNFVLITSAGLHEIGVSNIPKCKLAYSLPIYDYRIDSSIFPQSGSNAVMALSASVNYGDNFSDIIGEKITNDPSKYSLTQEYNALTIGTASISGTSAIHLNQILPSSINLFNGLPINNQNVSACNFISGTNYPTIVVGADTTFVYQNAPSAVTRSSYIDPISAIDFTTNELLYPVTTYNPAYTSANGLVAIDGTFHFTIGASNSGGNFKYNKVALFIQAVDVNDVPLYGKLPVLFAYVVYSTPITISNQTPTMDTQVQLKFVSTNESFTLAINSNTWATVPSSSNQYQTGQYFYGDVAIGTSGLGGSWNPEAKLSLTDQTGRPQLSLSNRTSFDKAAFKNYANGVLTIYTSASENHNITEYSPNYTNAGDDFGNNVCDSVGTYIFGNLGSTTVINPNTKSSFIISNKLSATDASFEINNVKNNISLIDSFLFGTLHNTSGTGNFIYSPYNSGNPILSGGGGTIGSVNGNDNVMFMPSDNGIKLIGSGNFIHASSISNSPGLSADINDSIMIGKFQPTSAISNSFIATIDNGGSYKNISKSNITSHGGNVLDSINLSKLDLAGGHTITCADRLNLTTLNNNNTNVIITSAANSDITLYSAGVVSAVCYDIITDLASAGIFRGAYKSHSVGFGNSLNTVPYAEATFVPMSIRECEIFGNNNSITVTPGISSTTYQGSFTADPLSTKVYTSTLVGWSNSINATGEINTSGNTVLGYDNTLSIFNIANHVLGTQNTLSQNYNSSVVGNYNIVTSANGIHVLGNSNTYAYVSTNSSTIGNGNYNSYCTKSLNIGNDNFIRNATIGEEYYNDASCTVSNSINVGIDNYIDAVYSPISDSYNFGSGNAINFSRRMNLGYNLITNVNTNDYFTNVGLITIGRSNDYTALTSSISGFQSIIEFGNGGPNWGSFGDENIKSTIMRLGSYFTTNTTKPFGSIVGGFGTTSGNTDVIIFDDILTLKTNVFSPASIQLPNGSKCIIYADIANAESINSTSSHNLKIRFIGA